MIRYLILFLTFVFFSVILFLNPFSFQNEIMNTFLPWATLSLAFVTVLTIIHSDVREGRQRDLDRLVNIMDWLEDIIRKIHPIETLQPPIIGDSSDNTIEILTNRDEINDINSFFMLGSHMQILARRIDKELYVSVRTLTQALKEMIQEDWSNVSVQKMRENLKTHEDRVYGLAKPLFDEIVKRIEEK